METQKVSTTVRKELVEQLHAAGIDTFRGFYKGIIENAVLEMLDENSKFENLKNQVQKFCNAIETALEKVASNDEVKALKLEIDGQKRIINQYILEGKHGKK